MQRTNIADTGIETSILGLGTVKFGRNTAVKYPRPFTIPTDKELMEILNTAAACGINLLDTAPAYGNSEERLGHLLKQSGYPWIISTKVGEIFNPKTGTSSYNFTPEYIQKSIENSLFNLQKEQLDIVLIHSDGNDEKIILNDGALEQLNHLKKKGLIRATGMSTKSIKGGVMAAEQSDVVMVTHNLNYQEESAVIDYAYQHNKGIMIKKAFASGHATSTQSDNINTEESKDIVLQSFNCIYQNKGVSSIILGSINPGHIKENAAKAIASFKKFNF
jgi:aryl-alcohol dehydrogenase-like predicted oxidoreductase